MATFYCCVGPVSPFRFPDRTGISHGRPPTAVRVRAGGAWGVTCGRNVGCVRSKYQIETHFWVVRCGGQRQRALLAPCACASYRGKVMAKVNLTIIIMRAERAEKFCISLSKKKWSNFLSKLKGGQMS